jgi:hypothetical protein
MTHGKSGSGPSASERTEPEGVRAQWERPSLRRLSAIDAEAAQTLSQDGVQGKGVKS